MGWDIYLVGEIDGNSVELGWWNYTHNCNGMIRDAGFTDWSMEAINGMSAEAFAQKLDLAIAALEREPTRFSEMDPPNGWGSYDTLLPKLREILGRCRAYPSAKMSASF